MLARGAVRSLISEEEKTLFNITNASYYVSFEMKLVTATVPESSDLIDSSKNY